MPSLRISAARRRPVACWTALAAIGLLVVGCVTTPLGGPVPAPRFAVGDHWHYRIIDRLRLGAAPEQLDVDVIASTPEATTIRFVRVDDRSRNEWTETIDSSGRLRAGPLGGNLARTFSPAAQMLAFPLEQGRKWRQSIETFRTDTHLKDEITIYGDVQGRTPVSPPAGAFDAVYIYRLLQLDDDEFWRSKTARRDRIWYVPEVKAIVREERIAEFVERGDEDRAAIRTESTVTELVSFKLGTL